MLKTWMAAVAAATVMLSAGAASAAMINGASAEAVTESASWALMILGFGGAGAMLRRVRSFVAAA